MSTANGVYHGLRYDIHNVVEGLIEVTIRNKNREVISKFHSLNGIWTFTKNDCTCKELVDFCMEIGKEMEKNNGTTTS